jgi:hypothetical protein
MRRRRHGDHHAKALTAALVVLAAVVALPPAAKADTQKLGPDGVVHRIVLDLWTTPGARSPGTVLRYVRQQPDGRVETSDIPGTDDSAIDIEPTIEIDPSCGQPVLVWSRNEGAGFDIYLSRIENGSWAAPRLIGNSAGDDGKPDLRVGAALIHVAWRVESAGTRTFLRLSLDRKTLSPAYGPETLPLGDPQTTALDGTGTADPAPPDKDLFLAGVAPPASPGEGERIIVWGVRDAPVPIDYCKPLRAPVEASSPQRPLARWVGDRFAVSFETPDRYFYRVRLPETGWTEMRVIDLGPETSIADARALLLEMLRRRIP